jgi:hypothetical protein
VNLTLAIIAGLVLLLPGITALTIWNLRGSRHGARRPDVQLSSMTAIFVAILVAMVTHILGYELVDLVLLATSDAARLLLDQPRAFILPANPYDVAVKLALVGGAVPTLSLGGILVVIILECFVVTAVVMSDGLDLFFDDADLRSQGWVFQHIVRPSRHGYQPVAYVLTLPVQGEHGIGYEGVIADVRQGENGELKFISLAEPQRFLYRLAPADPAIDRPEPVYLTSDREWIGGVVSLDAAVIRNVVVHSIPPTVITDLEIETAEASS